MAILIYLIVFSLPLYLVRLKIFWIPTTVLELMIYVVFFVWLLSLLKLSRAHKALCASTKFLKTKLWIPIMLLLAGCAISTILTPYKLTSLGILKGWFIDPILFFMVLVNIIKTKEQVRKVLAAFSLSGAMVAMISLGYLIGKNLTFDGRLRAFFLSPNHLAMYLAPALLIAFYFWLTSEKLKYFWLTVIGLIGVVLYFTLSYGAWLGVMVGALFLFWSFIKNLSPQRKKAILLYCYIAILLIIIVGAFQIRSEKFQNFLYSPRSSFQSRLMVWRAGLRILEDHSLWGIGLGTFQKYYLDYASYFKEPYLEWAVPQPHSLFLAFWLQTGMLGLLGFVWIVFKFFKMGFRHIWKEKLSICLLSVMIYILVHGIIDTTYCKNDLSMIFWMVIGLMVVLSRFKNTEAKPL